jgi:DICT domain-containing protein
MSLTELIAGVEAHRKTVTVFNADADVTATLREHFNDRNVDVKDAQTPAGPQAFVVLGTNETFITAASVDEVLGRDNETVSGSETEAYRPILDHLDETLFTSYDMSQMASASHEIEDRAWRVGRGTIHAGFQTLSALNEQIDTYEQLARQDDLTVYVYAFPDTAIPGHEDITLHIERAKEIRNTWFVVYDGAGDDNSKCALLAEERDPGAFYGFWTYDPGTVDWMGRHLCTNYGITEPDNDQQPTDT